MEENKNALVEQKENYVIRGLDEIGMSSSTQTEVITNITDSKQIFNLENKVDMLLNDCVDEIITVKQVLIKKYYKPLKEPVIDDETGEIIKDTEISMSCCLVDESGVSYATGSKVFTLQLLRFLQMNRHVQTSDKNTFDIKIIKKKMSKTNNLALSFELV